MSQIPQRHFPRPKGWLTQQGTTQTSLRVPPTRSRATGATHQHRRICKSRFLKWKQWLSTEGGTDGPRPQNWYDFFQFVWRRVSV